MRSPTIIPGPAIVTTKSAASVADLDNSKPTGALIMTRNRVLLTLLAVCVLSLVAASAGAVADPPAVGSPAPGFNLMSNEGKSVDLKDFKGKWVVLYFYPKDFTSGCTLQAHNFQRDLTKYQSQNAVILGVSADTVQSHKDFCEKEGLNFKLLADPDLKTITAYGSAMEHNGVKMAARNTFLIDPDGKIARVYLKVSPAGHSEEVLKECARLHRCAKHCGQGMRNGILPIFSDFRSRI
jgi:peroxiredoxin Q/BCP